MSVPIRGRFVVNSVGLIRRLAALGQGIVMMPEEIVTHELANGELVRVLPEWSGAPVTVYAVTETRLLPAKTQHFIDFLRGRLSMSVRATYLPDTVA